MEYIDCHCHHESLSAVIGVRSYDIADLPESSGGPVCAGIHPWRTDAVTEYDWQRLETVASARQIVAVGECGFDRLRGAPLSEQRLVFERQLTLAQRYNLPVVIHCVRAWPELLAVRRQFSLTPWLIHGFNGNAELAAELAAAGCYLSFGAALLRSVRLRTVFAGVAAQRILLETDEFTGDINMLYAAAAVARRMSPAGLKYQMRLNFDRLIPEGITMKDNERINRDWLARTRLLLGDDLVERLHDAHVLVVGLGGVGAYAAEMICRAGVGTMTIIDGDVVEVTNLNRQLPAMTSTIGTPKVDIVAKRLQDINPRMKLYPLNEFLRDERTDEVLDATTFHYVVDAIDALSPKVNLIAKCYDREIPIISSMGSGGRFDPSKIQIGDISDTFNCRLAKMVRKRLHRRGINRGIKVVFSPENVVDEAIEVYEDEDENVRSMVGTISYLPALFGCHCASVVIRDLLGKS